MLRYLLVMAVLSVLVPFAAQAEDFDWSYGEASLVSVSPAHNGSSLTGAELDGSYALTDQVHGIAGFQHVSCCSASQNSFDAGAGWNTKLSEQVALYVDGQFLSTNASGNGNHTGWGVTGGLRAWIVPKFELDGYVSHTDVSSDTENTIGVRALYSLDMYWRVFAGYSNNSGADTFMIGARYVF
jgi:hypothetical protein